MCVVLWVLRDLLNVKMFGNNLRGGGKKNAKSTS